MKLLAKHKLKHFHDNRKCRHDFGETGILRHRRLIPGASPSAPLFAAAPLVTRRAKVSEAAEKVWRPPAVAGAGNFLPLAATGRQVRSGLTARQGQQSGTRRSVSSQPEKMLYTIGSRTMKRAPSTRPAPSRRFSAEIWPCRASTICRLIDSPSPECCPNFSPVGLS